MMSKDLSLHLWLDYVVTAIIKIHVYACMYVRISETPNITLNFLSLPRLEVNKDTIFFSNTLQLSHRGSPKS